MFQLRAFVHRRLYAAAEEILGEVERTITSALTDAGGRRPGEELRRRRQRPDPAGNAPVTESPLVNSTMNGEEVLQETPTQNFVQEEYDLSTAPASPQTSADTENNDGNYCLVQIDFKIKEEQEETGDDSQTLEVISPTPQVVKTEEDQPQDLTNMSNELAPVSSDCSAAQSENSDSDEEWVQSKGAKALQGQNGSMTQKAQASLPDGDDSPKSQKDRSVCPVCGKVFQYIRPFMKHLRTHNRTSESTKELLSDLQSAHNKRLVCDVCGKKFTNPGCLHIHSKIHTGIKDFKCQDCGKSFLRKEHLVVHMRTHSGERPYNCDICGKAFTQSQNLTVHRRTHTGERPYQCGSCGKLFYTRGQLKKHTKPFSGEKPYSCDICGKTFCQRGRMIRHKEAHAAGCMG